MKRAFTLIELLVVIAIIAILAAILFPVFAQAKMAAKKTSDLSNMKQIATGTMIYLGDNDDVFPMNYQDWTTYQNSYNWSSSVQLGPYLKNTQIFMSPGESSRTGLSYYDPLPNNRKAQPMSYLANALQGVWLTGTGPAVFGPNSAAYYYAKKGITHWAYGGSGTPTSTGSTSQTELEAVSEIIMFTGGKEDFARAQFIDPRYVNTEIWGPYDYWFGTDLWYMATQGAGLAEPAKSHYAKGLTRFSGGSNYSFGDSSAKFLKPGALFQGAYLSKRRWFT
ncbi:MAG: prepilin-type N-terminal cleavage/methylation domain-containing protein, partial [Chlorobia bacterium]|nr:prepilin-type N-terminal cleavage/methylation domain-containing protein [Fimbriimonadaceae bacterium]